jgi:hypothetical protein
MMRSAPGVRLLALLGVATVLLPGPALGGDPAKDPLEPALGKVRTALVGRLDSLATWTEDRKLGAFRHRVFRLILTLSPDHARARSALKYSRKSKKHPWVQSEDYAAPPDWNAGLLPEGERRLAEALEKYRDDVLAIVGAEGISAERRDEETERLIDILPDDPTLRGPRGDVEEEGRWLLPETPRSRERREKLLEIGQEALKVGRIGTTLDVKALQQNWHVAFRSQSRGVYALVAAADGEERETKQREGEEAVAAMEGAEDLTRRLVGGDKGPLGPRMFYSFPTREFAREWLAGHREYRSELAQLEHLAGLHLPGGVYMTYGDAVGEISVLSARLVVSTRLSTRFQGRSRGWLGEGVGQRIVWYVLRRHGGAFVSVSETDQGAGAEMGAVGTPKDPAEWLAAAASVLDVDGPARLAGILTRKLNAMTTADVLLAYGLAAYLLEAQPTLLVPFLEANTSGDDAVAQVREVFDLGVAELAWRLRRWLRETG